MSGRHTARRSFLNKDMLSGIALVMIAIAAVAIALMVPQHALIPIAAGVAVLGGFLIYEGRK